MLVSVDSTFLWFMVVLFKLPSRLSYHILIRQFCVGRERFEATAGDVFIMSKSPFKKGGAILANSKQTWNMCLLCISWGLGFEAHAQVSEREIHEIICLFLQRTRRLYMLTTSKHRFYLAFFIIYFVWKHLFIWGYVVRIDYRLRIYLLILSGFIFCV